MQDRRLFARMHLKVPLKLLDSNTGREGIGESIDISGNGIGIITFVSKENLAVNTKLEMWLDITGKQAPFYMCGEVTWSQFLADGTLQRVGIRLNNVDFIGLAKALENKKLGL